MLQVLWASWECARCDWRAKDWTTDDIEAFGLVRTHVDAHDMAAAGKALAQAHERHVRHAQPPDIGPDVPGGGAI